MTGFRTDLDRLMPHADLVVLSSHTEGLPVVVLEALAAGVAVVATSVGGVPEVIHEDKHGLLVAAGDAVQLSDRIDELLRDPRRRCRLAQAGQERVVTEFSFAVMARRYQELFARVTGKSPTPAPVPSVS
jgi:glycosyltransferase involved in cell wall biosynthesis